jgi:hypothetical protein
MHGQYTHPGASILGIRLELNILSEVRFSWYVLSLLILFTIMSLYREYARESVIRTQMEVKQL